MTRVFEGETVQHPTRHRDRERIEYANCPRIAAQELTEIRLPQPAIHVQADLEAEHGGDRRERPARPMRRAKLA